jgi:DHA1 family inner membrane transport protein
MPLALLALAIGAFAIGTTEFAVVGLLPSVASSLHVSIPTAGLLVTGYALSVAVGAPLTTAAGSRLPRKTVLLGLMGLFIAGNLLCAVSTGYAELMTGRVIAALCHGAFFGVGSVVAADLVAPQRRAGAIALMFSGLTLANVLGVPLGTLLGQHFGWRSAFWAISGLGVLALLGLFALVPRTAAPAESGLRGELGVFRRPQVWLALGTTALGFGGLFASFTYFAPMMTGVTHFSPSSVTWLLVVFGTGLCVGNAVGGRAADRWPHTALPVALGLLVLVLAGFSAASHERAAAAVVVFLLGVIGFATVPPLQASVLAKAHGAPTLASAVNIGAFNLGNAIGAWLGGLTVGTVVTTAPDWVGAALVAGGLLLALLSRLLDRAAPPASPVPTTPSLTKSEV